jgi:hypothetical protein
VPPLCPASLRRLGAFAAVMALAVASPLAGQRSDTTLARTTPILVRYGKWATLAATIGMGIKAADAHREADAAFERLSRYCEPDHTRCYQRPDGAYIDPVAERYYRSSVDGDRRARRWLIGGELALVGTVGLFVWELTGPRRRPRDIPFEPTLTFTPEATRLGLRAAF